MEDNEGAARPLSRRELKQRTRSRLLGSATRVFARCGLHQASIDDVAADAGLTKGAFYANFASKQELFLAMLDERFRERLEQIELRADAEHEITEQARAVGEDFVSYLAADPDWQRLFFEFVTQAARDESFRAELVGRYRDLREGIARLFTRRAAELGIELPFAAEQMATMTFAMANGFALERMLEPENVSDELFGLMLVVFFAGLRAIAQEGDDGARTAIREKQTAPSRS